MRTAAALPPLPEVCSQYESRAVMCSLAMALPFQVDYRQASQSLDAPDWIPTGSMLSVHDYESLDAPVIGGVYR